MKYLDYLEAVSAREKNEGGKGHRKFCGTCVVSGGGCNFRFSDQKRSH